MAHRRIKSNENNEDKILINVIVKPNSRQETIEEIGPNTVRVKVKEPPEKGKANKRVIELLSKRFNVPISNISILRGHQSRNKLICIELK